MAEVSSAPEAETLPEQARLARRAQISALESHMLAADEGDKLSIDDMTAHFFASGVYARQMSIPAGVLVVGKLHKTEHLSVLLSGSVQITTETGTVVHKAPKVMVAPPGTKRVALALSDCIWLTFHAVGEERDLKKIEERFIAKSFEELEALSGDLRPEIAS